MKKNRKNKEKNIDKIILITILIVFVSLLVLAININSDKDFEKKLKTIIEEINDINKIVNNIDFNDTTSYTLENGLTCYATKNNSEKYIERLKKVYIFPFYEYSNYNLVLSDKEEKLYVCIPEKCTINKIKDYYIVAEEKNIKVVRIDDKEYILNKIDNTWKFVFPILICDN